MTQYEKSHFLTEGTPNIPTTSMSSIPNWELVDVIDHVGQTTDKHRAMREFIKHHAKAVGGTHVINYKVTPLVIQNGNTTAIQYMVQGDIVVMRYTGPIKDEERAIDLSK